MEEGIDFINKCYQKQQQGSDYTNNWILYISYMKIWSE